MRKAYDLAGYTAFPRTNPQWSADTHGYNEKICEPAYSSLKVCICASLRSYSFSLQLCPISRTALACGSFADLSPFLQPAAIRNEVRSGWPISGSTSGPCASRILLWASPTATSTLSDTAERAPGGDILAAAARKHVGAIAATQRGRCDVRWMASPRNPECSTHDEARPASKARSSNSERKRSRSIVYASDAKSGKRGELHHLAEEVCPALPVCREPAFVPCPPRPLSSMACMEK